MTGSQLQEPTPAFSPRTGDDTLGPPFKAALLNVHQVAELLQVPVSWVYERVRKRSPERLPCYRLGKYWRFRELDLLAWIERQRVGREHSQIMSPKICCSMQSIATLYNVSPFVRHFHFSKRQNLRDLAKLL